MKTKTLVIAGMILMTGAAKASPRTDFLSDKLKEARTIEVQAESKYRATEARYRSAASYRRSLEKEIRNVRKREEREYKAAIKAKEAEYMRVNPYLMSDVTAPTSIRWEVK